MRHKTLKTAVYCAASMLIAVGSAQADLVATFDEGAPKDRFTFQNVGNCTIENATLTLDLSGSAAGLIFDVTNSGAGVEVFQPFELVAGEAALQGQPIVRDGDTKIELKLLKLATQQAIAFTIDVDDTMGGREITVSDSEIKGAKVFLAGTGKSVSGEFSNAAKTRLELPDC